MITSENNCVTRESSRVIKLKSRSNSTAHSACTGEVPDIFDRHSHVLNDQWQLMCLHFSNLETAAIQWRRLSVILHLENMPRAMTDKDWRSKRGWGNDQRNTCYPLPFMKMMLISFTINFWKFHLSDLIRYPLIFPSCFLISRFLFSSLFITFLKNFSLFFFLRIWNLLSISFFILTVLFTYPYGTSFVYNFLHLLHTSYFLMCSFLHSYFFYFERFLFQNFRTLLFQTFTISCLKLK